MLQGEWPDTPCISDAERVPRSTLMVGRSRSPLLRISIGMKRRYIRLYNQDLSRSELGRGG